MQDPAVRSFPKNMKADAKYVVDKCESLGSGKQLILQGIPSAMQGIFHRICQFFDVIFPNMQLECCMKRQGPLRGNFDLFAASGESIARVLLWKTPFKTNCREGLSCGPVQFLQYHI